MGESGAGRSTFLAVSLSLGVLSAASGLTLWTVRRGPEGIVWGRRFPGWGTASVSHPSPVLRTGSGPGRGLSFEYQKCTSEALLTRSRGAVGERGWGAVGQEQGEAGGLSWVGLRRQWHLGSQFGEHFQMIGCVAAASPWILTAATLSVSRNGHEGPLC